MKWQTQETVKRAAAKGPKAALRASIVHWQQLCRATPKELFAVDNLEDKDCAICERFFACSPNCQLYESDNICMDAGSLYQQARQAWMQTDDDTPATSHEWKRWQKASREMLAVLVRTSLMKIRAIIDGKEVFGWYRYNPYYENHELMVFVSDESRNCYGGGYWREAEINVALCAEDTGRDDKHGKRIFGSRGKMQGGDRVTEYGRDYYFVTWDNSRFGWHLRDATDGQNHGADKPLYDSQQLEIVPRKENEQ